MYEIELFFKNYDMNTKHRTDYICVKNAVRNVLIFFLNSSK